MSPLSSLVVDFGEGGALSANKQKIKGDGKDDFCQVALIVAIIILTWPFCLGGQQYKSLWENSVALAIMCCFVVYTWLTKYDSCGSRREECEALRPTLEHNLGQKHYSM